MKILLKKNLIIFKKPYEWADVKTRIEEDYGKGIFLISWRTRRELGFSVRTHTGLSPIQNDSDLVGRYYYQEEIHLDFFDESALSWFCLKYLNNPTVA